MGKSDFKKAIRERMKRTGENYTQARTAILLERAPKFEQIHKDDVWRTQGMANWALRMGKTGVVSRHGEYETTDTQEAAALLATVAQWAAGDAFWGNGVTKAANNYTLFPSGGGLSMTGAFQGNGGIYIESRSAALDWFALDSLRVRPAGFPGFDVILIDCAPEPSPHLFTADERGRTLCVLGPGGDIRPLRRHEDPGFLPAGDRQVHRYDGGSLLICAKGSPYNSLDGLSPIYGNASHDGKSFDAHGAPHSHMPRTRFLSDLAKLERALAASDAWRPIGQEVEARMYFCRNGLPLPFRT